MSPEIRHEIPDEDIEIIEHEESMDCICGPTVREVRSMTELHRVVVVVEHYSLTEHLAKEDNPECGYGA